MLFDIFVDLMVELNQAVHCNGNADGFNNKNLFKKGIELA